MASTCSKKNKQSGFTIIEIVITLAISVFVFMIIADIFISHNRLFNTQSALADVTINTSLALNRLQRIIKTADEVVAARTINSVNYTTGRETLILRLPSIDASQNIIANTFDYAAFHLNPLKPAELVFSLQADPASVRRTGDTLISSYVEKINFNYNSATLSEVNLVSIFLSNARTTFGSTLRTPAQTAISLRN
jgi:prepilin-type N-terminal cleavage/methylation domain-containing protein